MIGSAVHEPVAFESLAAGVLDEYRERLKRGERPTVDEYTSRHPQAAELLRNVLATFELLDLSLSRPGFGGEIGDSDAGTLGDFRLIREVGRGGMGVVYEAEQISLNRHVALKVLPFAATMDPRQLQRFRNEAQAAACLHHANIVPVHGVGCERAVHFYAMQLIEGQSLAQVITELKNSEEEVHHGGTEDTEKKKLTAPGLSPCSPCLRGKALYRRIAELIAHAADALEYAHSMGVVHRDIKPANLMLDNAGHLWVTDFGLAKSLSPDVHGGAITMTGDMIGTLRYMSPEQALAKHGLVDHRTDIYSLGATLYELLTLRPAVDGADKQEILKRIAFEEPTPLRTIDASIPPELETIALKALANDPADRYATADDFAADLRRWLNHQTIRARRPSLAQRADKWMRRHSTAVLAAAGALLIGTGVSAWQAVKARDARHEAEDAKKQAVTEAAIARAVNNFLQGDLLRQVTSLPQNSDEFDGSPDLTVKEALDRSAARIGDRFQNQPLVEAEIRSVIGEAYGSLHEHALAVPHLERAVALRQTYLDPDHPNTIASKQHLAGMYSWAGQRTDAIRLYRQVLENREAQFGPDDPKTLLCVLPLADAYAADGQWDTSVRLLEPVLEKQRILCGPTHADTLATIHVLARAYGNQDRFAESIALHEELLNALKSMNGPLHSSLGWPLETLANVCQRAGMFDRAEQLFREVLDHHRKREDTVGKRNGIANSLGFLAVNELLQRRYDAAETLVREALALNQIETQRRFYWTSVLGAVLLGKHNFAEAEPLLLQGYEGMKQREPLLFANDKRRLSEAGEWVVRFYGSSRISVGNFRPLTA